MTTRALFAAPEMPGGQAVRITFDGEELTVPSGISVAAALLLGGATHFRSSVVGSVPRAPYCMMGICFECLVEIDGTPARQSCLVEVRDGMRINRQSGAAGLDGLSLGDVHE